MFSQPSLQINTYRSYHNMIYGRIKRYFSPKSITIASLRPNQIDEFYQSIFDEGMVANTVIHYHAVMRRAFQQAYKKEILSANPFDRVERPKKNKFFGQNLSEEELLTLLSLARSETIYPAIILAGCMGLRRSEALGMRWSRIDMEKREVLLDTKVVEVEIDGEKILKPIEEMKNSSSRRSLPIPAPVYEMLVEQKAQQDLYRRMFKGSYNRAYDDYVCTDKLGNLLTPRYVTLRFSQVLEKNGMRHIRFHDLRHTFATASLEHGMDIKTLSTIIGHVSSTTTLNTYTHVTDAMRQNAADKIDQGIGRAEPKPRREAAPQKPAPSTFQAHKGQRRKPGTGCVSQINDHLWEGRYSPIVNGQRMARNVYAKTEAECEKKLAELIREMKAEIVAGKNRMKPKNIAG